MPRSCCGVEALAVVLDRQQQAVRLLPHGDPHIVRPGVLHACCAAPPARCDRCRSCAPPAVLRKRRSAATFTHTPLRLDTSRACHCSAGTSPRSSSIEGRSSSAMLRTTPIESSTSFLISSALAATPPDPGCESCVERLAISTSTPVSAWPTSSCSSREIERRSFFLRLHQARGELLQFRARLRDLLIALRGLGFQAQNLAHAERRQQQAQPDGQPDGDRQAPPRTARTSASTFSFPVVQLRLVDGADLVGDAQHRHAPRKHFVAQKRVSVALPLSRQSTGTPAPARSNRRPAPASALERAGISCAFSRRAILLAARRPCPSAFRAGCSGGLRPCRFPAPADSPARRCRRRRRRARIRSSTRVRSRKSSRISSLAVLDLPQRLHAVEPANAISSSRPPNPAMQHQPAVDHQLPCPSQRQQLFHFNRRGRRLHRIALL